MPKIDVDYQNTIIYGIFKTDNPTIYYVGMTTNFCKRKAHHKSNANITDEKHKKYNFTLYNTIRNNGGWEAFTMNVIEIFSCNSRLEASVRENHYFHLYNATMNGQVPNQTKKIWGDNYRKTHKPENKIYRDNHKDEIKLNKKEYYQRKKLEKLALQNEPI